MHASTPSPYPVAYRGHRPDVFRQVDPALRNVIEQTVARVFDVDIEHMRLPTRGPARAATARQVAMYLAHVVCGLSLTEAGELFERDRTTVAHACHVVEDRREDQDFDRAIELLENIAKVLSFASAA